MNIEKSYAELDKHLLNAQREYEKAIKVYGKIKEELALAIVEYEEKFAEKVKEITLTEPKLSITAIKEMAKTECIKEYAKKVRLEELSKKAKAYMKGWEERIQTYKILLRIKYNLLT